MASKKNKKGSKSKNKRRNIHQTIEIPKTDYKALAEKSEKMRRDRILHEAANGGTREYLFSGSASAWDRISPHWRKAYLGKKDIGAARFHYHQALCTSFANEYDTSGILLTLGGEAHYFAPLDSSLSEELGDRKFVSASLRNTDTSIFIDLAKDLEELGYRTVILLAEIQGRVVAGMFVVGGDIQAYDYWKEENYSRMFDHNMAMLKAGGDKIEISPIYTYGKLRHLAIENYNRHNRFSPIRNARELPPATLKRIMLNYLRHNCTVYDDLWQGVQDRVDLLHRVYKLRVNRAIEAAYPQLDEYIASYLAPKRKQVATAA